MAKKAKPITVDYENSFRGKSYESFTNGGLSKATSVTEFDAMQEKTRAAPVPPIQNQQTSD